MVFADKKKTYEGKLLPEIHPDHVRVQRVMKRVVTALQKGLKHDTVSMVAWSKKMWSKASTLHLEGLDWEVIVVDEPIMSAFVLAGGKIVVYTGILKHLNSDSEVAAILGHEVGYAVARHEVELFQKLLLYGLVQLVLYHFIIRKIIKAMSNIFQRLPFTRRDPKKLWSALIYLIFYRFVVRDTIMPMSNQLRLPCRRRLEKEADYIGLLLMASAGYDPLVAPSIYTKLGNIYGDSKFDDYLSTHPSGKQELSYCVKSKS